MIKCKCIDTLKIFEKSTGKDGLQLYLNFTSSLKGTIPRLWYFAGCFLYFRKFMLAYLKLIWQIMTVCSYHVMYVFQSESTLYICLNVKELLAQNFNFFGSLFSVGCFSVNNLYCTKRVEIINLFPFRYRR